MAYKEDPKKALARNRRWRAANPEKKREQDRRHRADNLEKVREASSRYRADNLEKVREKDRRYRADNLEKVNEYRRRRRAADPETAREAVRRLAAEAFAAYGHKCVCCETTEDPSLDHIRHGQPPEDFHSSGRHRSNSFIRRRLKAAGWPKDQIQLLCCYCNRRKGKKHAACPCGGLGSPAWRRRNAPKATTP